MTDAAGTRSTPAQATPSPARAGNRLGSELSPYLLQHAENPVDWQPWDDEAFALARRSDRPVFLSIGYATCHWCHVMEHESFEDQEVASLLNETFVCIKVDREERPDVDQVYMTVCQMLTGGGGWPLTVMMTPDRRPFFAGTYIPKHSRLGRPGMLDIVPEVQRLWRERRDDLLASAASITGHLQRVAGAGREPTAASTAPSSATAGALDAGRLDAVIEAATQQLAAAFDAEHGGFGSAPKFPSPHNLVLLLHYAAARDDERARQMAMRTLDAMRRGGLWDHVGFGFHRYSTDREWLVPHFEKMIYDQAMLLLATTEAWRDQRRPGHEQAMRELITYVLRDMTAPEGGFYSAEDADSEGAEGKHYLWTLDELVEVLGEADARLAGTTWNATAEGNFRDEASGRRTGANILHLGTSRGDGAGAVPDPARLALIRERLHAARCQRPFPLKDDKILADWNGLMAGALARAGAALGEPEWIDVAERAVGRVLEEMRDDEGRLLHRLRNGRAAIPAFLDDHVFLTWALVELHQATLDPVHLERALELQQTTLEHFWDAERGGLFFTSGTSEELLIRSKELYDGAIPSGSSVAVSNLLRLSRLTGDTRLAEHADRLVQSAAVELQKAPAAHTAMLDSLLLETPPAGSLAPLEIVIAGEPGAEDTRQLVETVRAQALPGAVILLVAPGEAGDPVRRLAPFTRAHSPVSGRAAAHVCRRFECRLPVTEPEELALLLKQGGAAGT